jgi:hypothetical protein
VDGFKGVIGSGLALNDGVADVVVPISDGMRNLAVSKNIPLSGVAITGESDTSGSPGTERLEGVSDPTIILLDPLEAERE